MRVVFDTNVFISGLQFGGKPESALQLVVIPECVLITSEEILFEIKDVLLRKFRWGAKDVRSALAWTRSISQLVTPGIALTDCVDPDDNRILEAALAGEADYIVSGDRHLLQMKEFRGIEIIPVSDFIDRVGVIVEGRG